MRRPGWKGAIGAIAAWVAMGFVWPGEVAKLIKDVERGAVQFNVQQEAMSVLLAAGTDESVAAVFDLAGSSDLQVRTLAARKLAAAETTWWNPPSGEGGLRLGGLLEAWLDLQDPDMRAAGCEVLGAIGATGDRQRISMMVTDSDIETRAMCVRSLLGLYMGSADKEAVKPLAVQILSDPYYEVRMNAIHGLGRLGVKETFVSFLPLLESDNPAMRSQSIVAIASIDPVKALPFAVKALGDPEREVKLMAIAALGQIASPSSIGVLEDLLADPGLSRNAVEALGRIPDPGAFEILLYLLDVPQLRDAALASLLASEAPSEKAIAKALATALDQEVLRRLLDVAAAHPSASYLPALERILAVSPDRKMDVLDVLRRIGGREALITALSLATDPTPLIRRTSLQASGAILEGTGRDPAADEVITDSLCDEERDVRLEAISLVARWKVEPAAPLLVPLMDSRYEDETVAASSALLALGETVGVGILVDALASASKDLRLDAAAALARERPAGAVAPLVALVRRDLAGHVPMPGRLLRADLLGLLAAEPGEADALIRDLLEESDTRVLGARAAMASGRPDLAGLVEPLLGGKNIAVRRTMAHGLWRVEGEAGRRMIDRALADGDGRTRLLAVLSLERSGAFDAGEKKKRLVAALGDGDELVRLNAASALSSLDVAGMGADLCSAYARHLSPVETIAAIGLLARAGAPCLEEPAGRLLISPTAMVMGAMVEGVRIGVGTGAVALTEPVRLGLATCAATGSRTMGERCESILDGVEVAGCPGWDPYTAAPAAALDPARVKKYENGVLDAVYRTPDDDPLRWGSLVFVLDGTLAPRVTVLEEGLVSPLPQPACGPWRSASILVK